MERRMALRRAGILLVAVNIGLMAAKAAVWSVTGSVAVGSEAVNSLADTAYSVVVLAGLYLTTRPPDFEHPHGHERIEPFVSLIVALGVLVAGGGVLYGSVTSLLSGEVATAGPAAAGVLGAAAVVKYLLYRYFVRLGSEQDSPALTAAGLDNRVDVLTASTALVGVIGAGFGYPLLDPIAGGLVGFGVLYTGFEIARDNVGYLIGEAPADELRDEILRRALSHPEVQGAHDVVAHYVGPQVDVSLHIEVEGDLTLAEAHAIETEIIKDVGRLSEVDDVFVHVDPKELGEWATGSVTDPPDSSQSSPGETVRDDPSSGDPGPDT